MYMNVVSRYVAQYFTQYYKKYSVNAMRVGIKNCNGTYVTTARQTVFTVNTVFKKWKVVLRSYVVTYSH